MEASPIIARLLGIAKSVVLNPEDMARAMPCSNPDGTPTTITEMNDGFRTTLVKTILAIPQADRTGRQLEKLAKLLLHEETRLEYFRTRFQDFAAGGDVVRVSGCPYDLDYSWLAI